MPEPKPEFEYRAGDVVKVLGGPYAGSTGTVKAACNGGWVGRKFWHLALADRMEGDITVCIVGTVMELVVRDNSPKQDASEPIRLVGVTGHKRAGKDTLAERLVEKYGFKRMAFADNVRKVALAIDPLVAEVTYGGKYVTHARLSLLVDGLGWEKAKEIPEVRRILQRIGTEGIRSLEPDFWIRQVMRRAVFSSAPVVVTDVRFPNEADAIKKAGGVIIRVQRPGQSEEDGHSSESAMDGYLHDWRVINDGTVGDLNTKVDELVASGFKPA